MTWNVNKSKRSPRTSMSEETKKTIRKIKKAIDNGADWKEELAKAYENESDPIQRAKISKSIINYI